MNIPIATDPLGSAFLISMEWREPCAYKPLSTSNIMSQRKVSGIQKLLNALSEMNTITLFPPVLKPFVHAFRKLTLFLSSNDIVNTE